MSCRPYQRGCQSQVGPSVSTDVIKPTARNNTVRRMARRTASKAPKTLLVTTFDGAANHAHPFQSLARSRSRDPARGALLGSATHNWRTPWFGILVARTVSRAEDVVTRFVGHLAIFLTISLPAAAQRREGGTPRGASHAVGGASHLAQPGHVTQWHEYTP